MNDLPPLTPRLRLIADMVPPGSRLADVGTDHAYLPAFLVSQGICPSCIAGDIHRGPLENAEKTLARYEVSDRVTTVLSAGLRQFSPGCADTVVIAGMGGDQIGEIVAEAQWLRSPSVTLLLQPMTMQERCRRSLYESGFVCECEAYAKEGKHLYVVMRYRFSDTPLPKPDEAFFYVGTARENGEPLAADYLQSRKEKLRRMIGGMEKTPRCEKEAAELRALLDQL